jgi:hypothetical protein
MQAFICSALVGSATAFSAGVGTLAASRVVGASAAQRVSMELRRDAKGYIIEDDLAFDLRAGVSSALGASSLKEVPPPIENLLRKVRTDASSLMFAETLEAIELGFEFFGVKFSCGDVVSSSSENTGSSKVLSMAILVGLTDAETLACFGEHYRDVLADPSGASHANIRALMATGLAGVKFPNGPSLTLRKGAWDGAKYSSGDGLAGSAVLDGQQEWDTESDVWIP